MRGRTPFLLSIATILLLGSSQSWLAGSVAEPGVGASVPQAEDGHGAPSLVGSLLPAGDPMPAALDHDDIPDAYQDLWKETLESLPAACRGALEDVFVQFDRPNQRGLASGRAIILYAGFDLGDPAQRDEARALFVHEFGHITDIGCIQGRGRELSAFVDGSTPVPADDPSVGFYSLSWESSTKRRADSRSADFASGYAASDPFEDFAETYAYFALQEPAFAARAAENPVMAKKYQWMKTYAFADGAPNALGQSVWKGIVPWDITLLPYAWSGGLVALTN
jgi:hypothetical protein